MVITTCLFNQCFCLLLTEVRNNSTKPYSIWHSVAILMFSESHGFYLNQTLEILNIPWKKPKICHFRRSRIQFRLLIGYKNKKLISWTKKKTKKSNQSWAKKLKVHWLRIYPFPQYIIQYYSQWIEIFSEVAKELISF